MLPAIRHWLITHNNYLKPFYFVTAWIFIITLMMNLWGFILDIIKRSKTMHSIPCSNCQYFTNDHHLKCTIKPKIANTELAIDCSDFHRTSIIN